MVNFHSSVQELRRLLGYTIQNGCCHGFSLRWIEAYLLGEIGKFDLRIRMILYSLVSDPNFWPIAIKKLQDKVKCGEELTADDWVALDILCFFESLELYQTPKAEFFGAFRAQHDVDLIANFAGSEKILHLGGLKTIYSESNIFSVTELARYLGELAAILNANVRAKETIAMLLMNHNHSMVLAYNPSSGWVLMDPNQYPPLYFLNHLDLLAKFINTGFFIKYTDDFMAFNLSVITKGNFIVHEKFAKQLSSFKSSHLNEEKILVKAHRQEKITGVNLALFAVRYHETELFKKLAQHDGNLNGLINQEGCSLTWLAAYWGYADLISELARIGANLNFPAPDGSTPLMVAAFNNHPKVVAELAQQNVDLNITDSEGNTPLWVAVIFNYIEVVRVLARRGADLNLANNAGCLPINVAVRRGYLEMITLLANYKVDLNAADKNGITPAFIAAREGDPNVLYNLKLLGVNFDKPSLMSTPLFNNFVKDSDEKGNLKREKLINSRVVGDKVAITSHDIADIMGHNLSLIISYKNYEIDCQHSVNNEVNVGIQQGITCPQEKLKIAMIKPQSVFTPLCPLKTEDLQKNKKRKLAIGKIEAASTKKLDKRIINDLGNNKLFFLSRRQPVQAEYSAPKKQIF